MLESGRKNEIREIVDVINVNSEKYPLSHATSAIEDLLKQRIIDIYKVQMSDIKKKIVEISIRKNNKDNADKIQEFTKQLDLLQNSIKEGRLWIFVEFVQNVDSDSARAIRVNNSIRISLPKHLADLAVKADGSFDYEAMKRLRFIVGHELGHITLHLEKWIGTADTRGTKYLSPEQEEEANFFSDKLIGKRRERNRRFYEESGYEKI